MTDTTTKPMATNEDKTMPLAIYVLHLLGFATLITPIVGVILAHVGKGEPLSWRTSHYTFAIRTFWLALLGYLVGWAMIGIGIPLTIVLVGIIPIVAGAGVLLAVTVIFAVRCGMGIVYAARGEPYPRPDALIL
jgi:uncharacterized membrane protein